MFLSLAYIYIQDQDLSWFKFNFNVSRLAIKLRCWTYLIWPSRFSSEICNYFSLTKVGDLGPICSVLSNMSVPIWAISVLILLNCKLFLNFWWSEFLLLLYYDIKSSEASWALWSVLPMNVVLMKYGKIIIIYENRCLVNK